MTQGFLLFSYNNEQFDYGKMARWSARRIKRWLDKPTTLVTDAATVQQLNNSTPQWKRDFDQIIEVESLTNQKRVLREKSQTFHNVNRIMSWDLTPYDETVVIDTDVVIQSSQLNKLWGNSQDLVVCDKSNSIFNERISEFEFINETSIKFFWATVFYFRKTDKSKIFFDYCKWVKENYNWNSKLFSILNPLIRNDYIWSIALHQLGGQAGASWAETIPWCLPFATINDRVLSMSEESIVLNKDKNLVKVKGQDIHIMNKFDLMNQIEKELVL